MDSVVIVSTSLADHPQGQSGDWEVRGAHHPMISAIAIDTVGNL